MQFKRWAWLAPVLALSLLALSCGEEEGGGMPAAAAPTATAAAPATAALTATAVAPATAAPTTTAAVSADRTGIPEVDAVIDTVLSGASLRPLVRFTTRPCIAGAQTAPPQPDQPICGPNEAAGTPVDFLPETISGCRIAVRLFHLRPDELDDGLLGEVGWSLYAVYRLATQNGSPLQYTAVFARSAPEAGYPVIGAQLLIEDGKVVAIHQHCGETRAELVEAIEPEDFVLPPREP